MALGSTAGMETRSAMNGSHSQGNFAWDAEDWDVVTKTKKTTITSEAGKTTVSMVSKVTASSPGAFPPVKTFEVAAPDVHTSETTSQASTAVPSFEWPPPQADFQNFGAKSKGDQPSMTLDRPNVQPVLVPDDFDPFADWPPRTSTSSSTATMNPESSFISSMSLTKSNTSNSIRSKRDSHTRSWSNSSGGPPLKDAYPSNNTPLNLNDWSMVGPRSTPQQPSASDLGDIFSNTGQLNQDTFPPRRLAPPPPAGLGKGKGRNPIKGIGSPRSKSGSNEVSGFLDLL